MISSLLGYSSQPQLDQVDQVDQVDNSGERRNTENDNEDESVGSETHESVDLSQFSSDSKFCQLIHKFANIVCYKSHTFEIEHRIDKYTVCVVKDLGFYTVSVRMPGTDLSGIAGIDYEEGWNSTSDPVSMTHLIGHLKKDTNNFSDIDMLITFLFDEMIVYYNVHKRRPRDSQIHDLVS